MSPENIALKDLRTLEEKEICELWGIKWPEGKIVKIERLEKDDGCYCIETFENGARVMSYEKRKKVDTETPKEKLERKKRERMGSLPEKTKRKVGKRSFK